MKKLIVSLLAALLVSAGLVAATNGAATAAPRCPYTTCVKTAISVKAAQVGPRQVRVSYRVRTIGNATPRGAAKVILKGGNKDIVRVKTKPYPGANVVRFFNLPKGAYQVRVKFIPARNSSFGRSFITSVVDVK